MLVEEKGGALRWIVEAVPTARLTKWKAALAPAYWSLRARLHRSVYTRARPSGPAADMASRTRWSAAYQMTHLPGPHSKSGRRWHAHAGWHPRRPLPQRLDRCDRFQQSRADRKWRWPRPSRWRSAPEPAPPMRSKRPEGIFATAAASAHPIRFVTPEGLRVEVGQFNHGRFPIANLVVSQTRQKNNFGLAPMAIIEECRLPPLRVEAGARGSAELTRQSAHGGARSDAEV